MQQNATNIENIEMRETAHPSIDRLPKEERQAGSSTALCRLRSTPVGQQSGQSMIEFALTIVIILVLLAGVVDLGRGIFTYLALRDAAQEGASFAALNPGDTTGIIERVCNSSDMVYDLMDRDGTKCNNNPPADPDDPWVEVPAVTIFGDVCNGNSIQVRVIYRNLELVTPFLGALIGQRVDVRASIMDTILQPACTGP